MIKDGFISKHESIEILQKFFESSCSFDQLYSIFKSKRTKAQLQKFVKQKFKQLVLEIQSNLCLAGCIKTMKFYDNKSDKLFDELIKMNLYFKKQLIKDFIEEERCKLIKHQKIPSYKRMRIYEEFVKYAEKKELFKYSILTFETLSADKRPYEEPSRLYPPTQLELINVLYELYAGNYEAIAKKLQEKGYNLPEYRPPLLGENLKNLELIGLYRCYRKSVTCRGGRGMNWGQFVKDESEFGEKLKSYDKNLLVIMVRIAIRGIHEASPMQIRLICIRIGRRYEDKPVITGRIQYTQIWERMGLLQGTKNESEPINKLRTDLLAAINSKIEFHPVTQK